MLTLAALGCTSPAATGGPLQTSKIDASAVGQAGGEITLLGGKGADWARTAICSRQGACTLYGYSIKSFGDSTDYLAIRLAPDGSPLWAKTYGGTNKDQLDGAIETQDGGALLYGWSQSLFFTPLKVFSPSSTPRPFIVKIDAEGKLEWARLLELGGDYSGAELEQAVQMKDGSFTFVGRYWQTTVGGGPEAAASGHFSESLWPKWKTQQSKPAPATPATDILILKLDADGKPVWLNRYRANAGDTGGWTLKSTANGGLMIGGTLQQGGYPPLLLTIDAAGRPLEAEEIKTPQRAVPVFLFAMPDNETLLGGTYGWNKPKPSVFTIRLGSGGKPKAATIYSAPDGIRATSAATGDDDRIGIAARSGLSSGGRIASAIGLLLSEDGKIVASYEVRGKGRSEFSGIAPLSGGRYRLVGDTEAFGATYFDLVSCVWNPGTDNLVPVAAGAVDVSAKSLNFKVFTGSLSVLHTIPVGNVDVRAIKLGAPQAAGH